MISSRVKLVDYLNDSEMVSSLRVNGCLAVVWSKSRMYTLYCILNQMYYHILSCCYNFELSITILWLHAFFLDTGACLVIKGSIVVQSG